MAHGETIRVRELTVSDNQGSPLKESEPASFKYYYDQPVSEVVRQGRFDLITMPVYICDDDARPEYPDQGTSPV